MSVIMRMGPTGPCPLWVTGRQYLVMLLLEKRKENKIINQPAIKIKVAGGKTVTFLFILQNINVLNNSSYLMCYFRKME
jgi:hypothetical protein